MGVEGVGWGEGARRSVGTGKRTRLPCACAGPRARPSARPLARAPVGACGGSVLPGGGVSPGEPLWGSGGGGLSVHAGGLGGCGAGRGGARRVGRAPPACGGTQGHGVPAESRARDAREDVKRNDRFQCGCLCLWTPPAA